MKKILLLVIFLQVNFFMFSQVSKLIGVRYSYGKITPHHKDMRYFIGKPVNQFTVLLGAKTSGRKPWQKIWNYPELGIGFNYANLGNNENLGNVKAIFGYYSMNFLNIHNFAINSEFGLGVAYLSKKFNINNNIQNIAIGTHINIFANLNLELQYITNKIIYFSNLCITHYSNGASKFPNLGLNILSLSAGVKYKVNNTYFKTKFMSSNWKKSWDIHFVQTLSLHGDVHSISNKSLVIVSSSVDAGIYINQKIRIGSGFDFLGDYRTEKIYINDTIPEYYNYSSIGMHLSCNLVIGKTQFIFQQLFFLKEKDIRQRVGFRFILGKHLILNATLLTHFFSAVAIEPGIGYRFGK